MLRRARAGLDALFTVRRLLIVNRTAKWLWIVAIPVTEFTGLRTALPWLLFMSLWANVVSHWTVERALEAQLEVKDSSEGGSTTERPG